MQEPSPKIRMYIDFTEAVAAGDVKTMHACVSLEFRANLGKGALSFVEFVNEVERQRTAFPDLGKNVNIVGVSEQNSSLRAVYDMIVNFTGRLTNDKGDYVEPTGKQVTITAVDHVIFDPDGKILQFTVTSNMLMTIEQMF